MKKIITIVLVLIASVYLFCNNKAKAEIIIDERGDFINFVPLVNTTKEFNLIKGTELESRFLESEFYKAYKAYLYEIVEFGVFQYDSEIYNSETKYTLTTYFVIEDENIIEYNMYLDGELFYKIEYIDNEFVSHLSKTIDLNEDAEHNCANFKIRNVTSITEGEVICYPNKNGVFLDDCYFDMGASLVYGYTYEYNKTYNNQDIYLITTNSNPLTMQEIEDSIIIKDTTDRSASFDIVENEYNLDDIDISNGGQYSFMINAYDRYGNITIQKCQVYVYDDTPPVLTGEKLVKDWNLFIYEDDLLDLFICDDPDATITIEKPDELLYNSVNRPNTYKVTATATDLAGNSSSCTVDVIIKDEEKPEIYPKKDRTEIYSDTKYTKDDIYKLLNIKDRCYGTELTLDILNYERYLEFWDSPRRIVLTIVATDPSGNTREYELEAYITDNDFPQIEIDTPYILILPADNIITKEDVIEKLLESGQITNVVSVESEYFNTDIPSGSYDLFVTDSEGNVYTHKIEIEAPSVNYDTPEVKEEKKDNNIIYVTIGVILMLGIAVAMLVIYKKKKH